MSEYTSSRENNPQHPEITGSLYSDITLYLDTSSPLLDLYSYPMDSKDHNAIDRLCGMHPIRHRRYPCRFKSKCEDFIVQEVLSDGSVVPLHPSIFYKLPGEEGDRSVIHGIMVKRDLESLRLMRSIRESGDQDFGMYFSGIKDKRAITSQRVGFTNINKSDLVDLLNSFEKEHPSVSFHKLVYRQKKIRPGIHWGNYFDVTLRSPFSEADHSFDIASIQKYFRQSSDRIPNYFGRQRFGSHYYRSHVVGWYLVKRKPEEAMKIYLGLPTFQEADSRLEERFKLLKLLHSSDQIDDDDFQHLGFEIGIAKYILKNRNDDPWKTLYLFPKTTIKIMIQSLASYIFNLYIQRRMEINSSLTEAIDGERSTEEGILAPVIGYEMEDEVDMTTTSGKIIGTIMNELQISFSDFNLNDVDHLWYGFSGYWRLLNIDIGDISVTPRYVGLPGVFGKLIDFIRNRDMVDQISIRIKLKSGQYFTSLIRNLFYPAN